MTGTVSETWCHWGMDVFCSDSKTDLKLLCDYCIKFQLFEGAQDVFSVDWWMCVACYYNTTSTDYPSTTRDTSVGPRVAVNIDFVDISNFFSIRFVWIIWAQYATDNLSGQQSVHFIGQCWYFNPQWIPVAVINKASSVWTVFVS